MSNVRRGIFVVEETEEMVAVTTVHEIGQSPASQYVSFAAIPKCFTHLRLIHPFGEWNLERRSYRHEAGHMRLNGGVREQVAVIFEDCNFGHRKRVKIGAD